MAHILVVEDEAPINDLITLNLTLVGHQCSSALDGNQALELARDNSFDLAVLDVLLPGIDGFSLLPQLKGTPTIFVTAPGAGTTARVSGMRTITGPGPLGHNSTTSIS